MPLVKRLTHYISQSTPNISQTKLAEVEYGLTMLLLTVVETSIIWFIAHLLGVFKYMLIAFLSFGGIRITAGGFHAKNPVLCFFSGFAIYIGIVYISIYYTLSPILKYGFMLLSLLNLYFFAPADNANKPIYSNHHRLRLKISSLAIAFALFGLSFAVDNKFSSVIIISIFVASLAITPLAYRITGMERREKSERTT